MTTMVERKMEEEMEMEMEKKMMMLTIRFYCTTITMMIIVFNNIKCNNRKMAVIE